MAQDTRWLERRHRTWHAVKEVPRPLRETLGRKRLVKSLQTHDLRTAQARRHSALVEFDRALEAARAQSGPNRAVAIGLEVRGILDRIEAGEPGTIKALTARGDPWGPRDEHAVDRSSSDVARDNALDDLHMIADDMKPAEAETLLGVAYGRATPLMQFVDSWIAEGGSKGPPTPRTANQYRSDLERLATWAKSAGIAETVEAFTRAVVGRYIRETITDAKVHSATGNRWISAPSAYWRWMVKRAITEASPWQGQSIAKAAVNSARGGKYKRPPTEAELVALLDAAPDPELADLIRVGALSGMRLEEIYRLTVADCAGGWFRVRQSKSEAGVRRVPVHSGLAAIVERRCHGKDAGAFLFHEAGPAREDRGRSTSVSKRFGRFRKAQGIDESKDGRRHSAVDFHSLRRWFITQARIAGKDRAMVAAVVGHKAGNITDDVYSGGPSDAIRRDVVGKGL